MKDAYFILRGNRVRIPDELVTVNREWIPDAIAGNREKAEFVPICKSGNLLDRWDMLQTQHLIRKPIPSCPWKFQIFRQDRRSCI